jgi:hypothetical protein
MNGYMENPVLDKRLTPFAEQLSPLLSQEELANQYKERRLVFNADFKRAMSAEIRPAIDALLQFASKQGHWVDINLLNDQRFVSYVHHARWLITCLRSSRICSWLGLKAYFHSSIKTFKKKLHA